MKRFKNILFFSIPGVAQEDAIYSATSLAKQNNARLTVMSVVKTPPTIQEITVAEAERMELLSNAMKKRQEQLEDLITPLDTDGIDIQIKVEVGIEFVEVVREVLRERHDIVVMAPDHTSGVLSRLFGSTSMHLMRKCPCPVWVVKPGAHSFKRILAAVDVTVDAWGRAKQSINPLILQLATSMARTNQSDLHLIQVWSVFEEGYLQVRGDTNDQTIRRLRKDTKRNYAQKLNKLLNDVGHDGIPHVQTHLKHGDEPAPLIVKLARKQQVDLLVMGTVCRTGLAGFFIGNTAEEVLNAVDCSVLTVKPQGFVSPVTLMAEAS